MSANELTIAVTGLNANDNPGPGVSVIRGIREAEGSRAKIIGLTYDPLDAGAYMSGLCDHVYLIPYPSQGSRSLYARLKEIHEKISMNVIVPTLDSELQTFLRIKPNLESLGIRSFLPTSESLDMCSKENIACLKETHGINVPRGMPLTNAADLFKLQDSFTFPIIVKGRFYDAAIAHTLSEAERIFHKFSSEWGLPVLIQEYVMGEEYDFMAVGDGSGGLIGGIPMRKLRLTEKGKAWCGITIEDPAMNAFAHEIIGKIKWKGPCELEIIKSREDSQYYLIEINPRFPAWCFLCTQAGQNLPWACVQLALGEPVQPFRSYTIGAMFLRHSMDMVYPLSMLESLTTQGELHGNPASNQSIRSEP